MNNTRKGLTSVNLTGATIGVAAPRRPYAPRAPGAKRLNLIQARLNDAERARLDALKRATGLNDSAVVRVALDRLAGEG